jgi:hypothetical protein
MARTVQVGECLGGETPTRLSKEFYRAKGSSLRWTGELSYAEVTLVTGITFLTSAAEILKDRLLGGLKASPVGIRFAVWTAVPTTIAAAIVSRSGNRI